MNHFIIGRLKLQDLDIAIVKSTNHVERPAKEKHISAIFSAVSATRPRADVAYCFHALARRLSRTHNWAVALKTLIVIHRALREVDATFHEELINYGRSRSHMLNLAHFKDESSTRAWEYSAWVRTYALFLEERIECFRLLKYDVETDHSRTKDLETSDLLQKLPALQELLYRVLGWQPQGGAVNNSVIQLALSLFFAMQRHDATRALDIYRRAGQQAEKLSDFYEICKSRDIGRGEKIMKIELPPASFLQAMEQHVRETPGGPTFRNDPGESKIAAPKETLAIDDEKALARAFREEPSRLPLPEPVKESLVTEPPELLVLNDPVPNTSELDDKNALALAVAPVAEQPASAPNKWNETMGWELALVTAPSSNENSSAARKLAGGFDKLTLDSLYDDAIRRNNQNASYNPWEPVHVGNPMMQRQKPLHHPFFASNMVAGPGAMAIQQPNFVYHQQHQMAMAMAPQRPSNPFGSPYGGPAHLCASGMPILAHNPYTLM